MDRLKKGDRVFYGGVGGNVVKYSTGSGKYEVILDDGRTVFAKREFLVLMGFEETKPETTPKKIIMAVWTHRADGNEIKKVFLSMEAYNAWIDPIREGSGTYCEFLEDWTGPELFEFTPIG
jgi:hypothetical protein